MAGTGLLILAAADTGPVPYLAAVITLAVLGALFGAALYLGSRVFAVELDPRIDRILESLPGANCGSCGLGGCRAYAEAVVLKGLGTGLCAPGGTEAAEKLAEIMGVEAASSEPKVAVVRCQGSPARARSRGVYAGPEDCRAEIVPGAGGGSKLCAYGCLGRGTCARACPFEALVMGPDGLPQVIERSCTGCGTCVEVCPRNIISLHPREQHVFVMCVSRDRPKAVRASCDVGCIGCRRCEKACKFEAIRVVDNLAVIDEEKCTSCGACIKVCPQGTIWSLRRARRSLEKKEAAQAAAPAPAGTEE